MSTEKKEKKSIAPADDMVKTVTEQLNTALTSLKEKLSEKEFNKRIQKAAKKLVSGIKEASPKKVDKKAKRSVPVSKKVGKGIPVSKEVKKGTAANKKPSRSALKKKSK